VESGHKPPALAVGSSDLVCIIGALILTSGVYLLTRLDVSSALSTVTLYMVVVGLGLGMVMPVLTLAVQNALPRTRLGVGTSAVTYLRTTGQTLGVALIGTIVNNTLTSELATRLPPQAKQLPPTVLAAATSQQVLVNSQAKATLIQRVTQAAVAHAPPQAAGQVTAQTHALLNQIFEASRQSLGVGIQHAFFAGLIICVVVVVLMVFLKDVPLKNRIEAPAAATSQLGGLSKPGDLAVPGADTQPEMLAGRIPSTDASVEHTTD
jgi:hypothetical protein